MKRVNPEGAFGSIAHGDYTIIAKGGCSFVVASVCGGYSFGVFVIVINNLLFDCYDDNTHT